MSKEHSEPAFECSASFADRKSTVPAILHLNAQELVWSNRHLITDTVRVPYCCIYGYEAPDASALETRHQGLEDLVQNSRRDRLVKVHYVEFSTPDLKATSSPRQATAHFLFEQRLDVCRFLDLAKQCGVFPKPRRILILVNPNGGVGRAKTINESIVKPMLKHSGLILKEQYTEYGRHAVDIAHKVNLEEVDTLVVVSGDGVLHEIINGLLSRPDWNSARRLPIGIIPAGSGNAIATSIGTRSPIVATLAVIRGETAKLDIFSLSQQDRPRIYSMLLFSWGMMADADIESDKYRWLGPLRFEIAGFIRMIRLRRYPGKVYVLPPHHKKTSTFISPPNSPDRSSRDGASTSEIQYGSLLKNTREEPPAPWRLLPNMPFFSMLLLLNCPSAGETLFFTDSIQFNDGIMRLWYSCETRFWKILRPFVLDLTNGKLVERELMQDIECGGVLIIPGVEGKPDDVSTHEVVDRDQVLSEEAKRLNIYERPGVFDVDGEIMPTARTLIEILPSFMDIIVPGWLYHTKDESDMGVLAKTKASLVVESIKKQQTWQAQAEASRIPEVAMLLLAMAATVTTFAVYFSEGLQVWAGIARRV